MGYMLLMLRLPAARRQLADASSFVLAELIEAYEVAHSAQQHFRLSSDVKIMSIGLRLKHWISGRLLDRRFSKFEIS